MPARDSTEYLGSPAFSTPKLADMRIIVVTRIFFIFSLANDQGERQPGENMSNTTNDQTTKTVTSTQEAVRSTALLADLCASCGQHPVAVSGDIYGLCDKCGNEYVESLSEMNREDESTHGLVG